MHGDALPRLKALLSHPVAEVRAEAARVFRVIDAPPDFSTGMAIAAQLSAEDTPFVLAALLDTIGSLGGVDPGIVERFSTHPEPGVRRAARNAKREHTGDYLFDVLLEFSQF